MSFVQHEIDDIENNNYIYDKLTIPFYIPFYALLRGMRAIKPKVVLLSRNTSCNTAPKIRRFLPKYCKYLMKLSHSQIMRYTTIKTLGLVAHLYVDALLELDSCTMNFGPTFAQPVRKGRLKGSWPLLSIKTFTTGPSTTAIFRPSLIDILCTTYIQLKVKNIFPISSVG